MNIVQQSAGEMLSRFGHKSPSYWQSLVVRQVWADNSFPRRPFAPQGASNVHSSFSFLCTRCIIHRPSHLHSVLACALELSPFTFSPCVDDPDGFPRTPTNAMSWCSCRAHGQASIANPPRREPIGTTGKEAVLSNCAARLCRATRKRTRIAACLRHVQEMGTREDFMARVQVLRIDIQPSGLVPLGRKATRG